MVNKVILVGRLGKDPEVRHLEGGSTVARFTVATNEVWRNREGEKQEATDWHNIVVWRRLAEIAESFLRKGSLIYLEGRLKNRSWEDQEGNKKYVTEVVADNFQMLDKKGSDNSGGQQSYQQQAPAPPQRQQQPAPQAQQPVAAAPAPSPAPVQQPAAPATGNPSPGAPVAEDPGDDLPF